MKDSTGHCLCKLVEKGATLEKAEFSLLGPCPVGHSGRRGTHTYVAGGLLPNGRGAGSRDLSLEGLLNSMKAKTGSVSHTSR